MLSVKKSFFSKYTEYGKKFEETAIKKYCWYIENSKKHDDFNLYRMGFHISLETPVTGASPDSVVHCTCHGWASLEIKCLWWMKDMKSIDEIREYVRKNKTCFVIVNNELHLDESHEYYYQVQLQMYVLKMKYCDFFVWCKHAFVTERISYNQAFVVAKLKKVLEYHKMIIKPELLARYYTEKVFALPPQITENNKKPTQLN